ncbi:MAG: hypothetical protein AB7O73_01420 [Bacteroidia bacterium]
MKAGTSSLGVFFVELSLKVIRTVNIVRMKPIIVKEMLVRSPVREKESKPEGKEILSLLASRTKVTMEQVAIK